MQRCVPLIKLCQSNLIKTYSKALLAQKCCVTNKTVHHWYSGKKEMNLNIDVTAVDRLQKILKEFQFLRVMVEGGGCSGFQYKFEIDTNIDDEEDMIFEKNGIKIISDVESVKILDGATIEYHKDLIRSGFRVVDIKQAEKGCSCGVSFSVKL